MDSNPALGPGVVKQVRLPADPDGILARLVGGVRLLAGAPLPRWAVVGGVAVMVHLAEAHRATRDVDAVADDDTGVLRGALAVVAQDPATNTSEDSVVLADGTKVDVIATGSWTPEQLPEDELDRMFVLSHWWALDTAVPTRLSVVDGTTVRVDADAPIADPAALVATKLQSMRRRRRDPAKAASDAYDVYRLLVVHDRTGAIADALAAGPADLGSCAAVGLEQTLVCEAERWAHRCGVHARGAAMVDIDSDDLEVVASLCVERIRRRLQRS